MAEQTTAGIPAALVALLRHAKADGWTFHRTTAFGRTDWSWSKDKRIVVAEPKMTGWEVHVHAKGDFFPDSVTELADILVAVGYLPAKFGTGHAEQFELEAENCELLDERDQALCDLDFQTKAAFANQAEATTLRTQRDEAWAWLPYEMRCTLTAKWNEQDAATLAGAR